MSGRRSRNKGYRIERELVLKHKEAGIPCKRVPLSGAQEGYPGDLMVEDKYLAEVKARASGSGFKTLERWLGENDLLFLRRDRADPLVVMPWEMYLRLLQDQDPP